MPTQALGIVSHSSGRRWDEVLVGGSSGHVVKERAGIEALAPPGKHPIAPQSCPHEVLAKSGTVCSVRHRSIPAGVKSELHVAVSPLGFFSNCLLLNICIDEPLLIMKVFSINVFILI